MNVAFSLCTCAAALLWVARTTALSSTPNTHHRHHHHQENNNGFQLVIIERRSLFRKLSVVAGAVTGGTTTLSIIPFNANADVDTTTTKKKKKKSRTEGYDVQKTEEEWSNQLSPLQYNVLRRGGTERQKSSILNTYYDNNEGIYACAGCGTALFSSADKFSSNTGWPSFASALVLVPASDGGTRSGGVQIVVESNGDQEVRCWTCGGHLGDLFKDGWRFVGTPAAKTGKRYCINGASLVFQPSNGGPSVRGDQPPPAKVIQYEPATYKNS